jgi:hypothetical protein
MALTLWAASALALRSVSRGAAVTTVLVFLGSTYMPVARFVAPPTTVDIGMLRGLIGAGVAVVWLLLFSVALRKLHSIRDRGVLNRNLNLALLCLVIVPAVNIGRESISFSPAAVVVSPPAVETAEARHRPDIYYIIPDAYGRADVLESMYGFDNSEFLDALEGLDFVICEASASNYCQTSLSLPSALNMSYLEPPHGSVDSTCRLSAFRALQSNAVMKCLREAGYTTVVHSSGYTFADVTAADIRYSPGPNEFEAMAAGIVLGRFWPRVRDAFSGDLSRYARITSLLNKLGDERRNDGPVFVFAHFLAPHAPFVFDEDGSERIHVDDRFFEGDDVPPKIVQPEAYRAQYARQVKGLNIHLLEAVERIIAASDDPCIIIIQADHGPDSETDWDDPGETNVAERMGILNAYLVPDEVRERLYPEITPVNSFRLVLNYVFGTDIPLLEDRVFFSRWHTPYDFVDVTQEVRGTSQSAQCASIEPR